VYIRCISQTFYQINGHIQHIQFWPTLLNTLISNYLYHNRRYASQPLVRKQVILDHPTFRSRLSGGGKRKLARYMGRYSMRQKGIVCLLIHHVFVTSSCTGIIFHPVSYAFVGSASKTSCTTLSPAHTSHIRSRMTHTEKTIMSTQLKQKHSAYPAHQRHCAHHTRLPQEVEV